MTCCNLGQWTCCSLEHDEVKFLRHAFGILKTCVFSIFIFHFYISSMGQDDRIIVRPGSSASDRLPLGNGRIQRPSGSRPGSTTGRPGSAASCGAASSASHG